LKILAVLSISTGMALAASVPVWLDDAITEWNAENAEVPIRFLDIKDSFVWYTMPKIDEISHSQIRERTYAIAESNGYQKMVAEELVTTGKPPTATKAYQPKKCWSRSFTLNIRASEQRVLSTLVCEDPANWYMGFRIVQ
jgi:hypothetical protein